MTNKEIVKALRCISTDGNVAPDCKGCPFYAKEHLDPELAAKVGTDEWYSCDCNAVGFAAADLIENQQNHIRALLQANDALRPAWIPVTERLPENAKHPGALCPKYLVATKYGITEGWYNPDVGGWFIITQYLIDDYIDFENGDILRVKFAKDGIVTHWMPLPPTPEE